MTVVKNPEEKLSKAGVARLRPATGTRFSPVVENPEEKLSKTGITRLSPAMGHKIQACSRESCRNGFQDRGNKIQPSRAEGRRRRAHEDGRGCSTVGGGGGIYNILFGFGILAVTDH